MRKKGLRSEDLDDLLSERPPVKLSEAIARLPRFDLGPCPAPDCTRRAQHGHLMRKGFVRENKVYVCREHLVDLHEGRLAVDGQAPDDLVWIVGEREVAAWHSPPEGTPS